MKHHTFVLLFSIASISAHSQRLYPLPNYIPKGYAILDTCTGNLNLDVYPDMILVLQKHNEGQYSQDMDNPVKRPLLVLLGQPDGTYKLAARNDNTVLCKQCGRLLEDPYSRIVIKSGYFTVEHYYGSRWINETRYITYKYNTAAATWYLHKISTESYNPDYPDDVGYNAKTKKDFGSIPFREFNLYHYDRTSGE